MKIERVAAGYSINLTEDELATLKVICGHIGGCPETSRRRHADDLRQACYGHNIPSAEEDVADYDSYCGIYFKDHPEPKPKISKVVVTNDQTSDEFTLDFESYKEADTFLNNLPEPLFGRII
jgi:hypothetical protein